MAAFMVKVDTSIELDYSAQPTHIKIWLDGVYAGVQISVENLKVFDDARLASFVLNLIKDRTATWGLTSLDYNDILEQVKIKIAEWREQVNVKPV